MLAKKYILGISWPGLMLTLLYRLRAPVRGDGLQQHHRQEQHERQQKKGGGRG